MSTKKICIHAMGIALFVVLTLCLQVPVFENYYLCLGYIAMAVYTYYLGAASGVLVGTLGVLIYCLLSGGLRGMPGWILGNVVIGVLCGAAAKAAKLQETPRMKLLILSATVVVSTAIGILGVKSLTEVVLYALPFAVRVANNIYAFVADVLVLIIGFGFCISCERILSKIVNS